MTTIYAGDKYQTGNLRTRPYDLTILEIIYVKGDRHDKVETEVGSKLGHSITKEQLPAPRSAIIVYERALSFMRNISVHAEFAEDFFDVTHWDMLNPTLVYRKPENYAPMPKAVPETETPAKHSHAEEVSPPLTTIIAVGSRYTFEAAKPHDYMLRIVGLFTNDGEHIRSYTYVSLTQEPVPDGQAYVAYELSDPSSGQAHLCLDTLQVFSQKCARWRPVLIVGDGVYKQPPKAAPAPETSEDRQPVPIPYNFRLGDRYQYRERVGARDFESENEEHYAAERSADLHILALCSCKRSGCNGIDSAGSLGLMYYNQFPSGMARDDGRQYWVTYEIYDYASCTMRQEVAELQAFTRNFGIWGLKLVHRDEGITRPPEAAPLDKTEDLPTSEDDKPSKHTFSTVFQIRGEYRWAIGRGQLYRSANYTDYPTDAEVLAVMVRENLKSATVAKEFLLDPPNMEAIIRRCIDRFYASHGYNPKMIKEIGVSTFGMELLKSTLRHNPFNEGKSVARITHGADTIHLFDDIRVEEKEDLKGTEVSLSHDNDA